MKRIGISWAWAGAALSLMLAACGKPEAPAAGPASPGSVAAPVTADADAGPATASPAPPAAETADNTPQVGQKIPEAETGQPVIVNGYRELAWEELMPEGEEERLAAMYQEQMIELYSSGGVAEGSAQDVATQFGTFNAVQELDGEKVRIPGYTVPFEYGADAKVSEFLLVPYFGACIHAPPPPPNQTILVRTGEPIALRDLAQAVWVEGTLKVEIAQTGLADAAYVIELEHIRAYEY